MIVWMRGCMSVSVSQQRKIKTQALPPSFLPSLPYLQDHIPQPRLQLLGRAGEHRTNRIAPTGRRPLPARARCLLGRGGKRRVEIAVDAVASVAPSFASSGGVGRGDFLGGWCRVDGGEGGRVGHRGRGRRRHQDGRCALSTALLLLLPLFLLVREREGGQHTRHVGSRRVWHGSDGGRTRRRKRKGAACERKKRRGIRQSLVDTCTRCGVLFLLRRRIGLLLLWLLLLLLQV